MERTIARKNVHVNRMNAIAFNYFDRTPGLGYGISWGMSFGKLEEAAAPSVQTRSLTTLAGVTAEVGGISRDPVNLVGNAAAHGGIMQIVATCRAP